MKIKNINALFLVLIVASLFVISSCFSSKKQAVVKKPQGLQFEMNLNSSLSDVIEKAEREGKFVFIDFYADWCLPCQLLDEEVFNKREVIKYMNDHFVSYKVDIEKANGANLKLLFNAVKLPTLLFLDQNGRELERREKTIFQTELLEIARRLRKNS